VSEDLIVVTSAERACEILTGPGANVIGLVINDSETAT
jgi:hypothetical protein